LGLFDAYHAFGLDLFLLKGDGFYNWYQHDNREFVNIGMDLLRRGGYYYQDRLTAYREPGAPTFFALAFALFGERYAAILLGNFALFVLTVVLAYKTAAYLFGDKAGIIAGFLTASNLLLIVEAVQPMCDPLVAACSAGIMASLVVYARSGSRRSLICLGLSVAAGTMSRGTTGLFLPILALLVLWRSRNLKSLVILAAPTVILLSAWTMRNYTVFHRFVPTSTRLGVTLLNTNGPRDLDFAFWSSFSPRMAGGVDMTSLYAGHPPLNVPAYETYIDDRCRAFARQLLATKSAGYRKLIARRFIAYLSPYSSESNPPWTHLTQTWKYVVMIVPGFVGLWWQRRHPWALTALAMVAVNTVFHAIVTVDLGQIYRLLIEPILAVAAAGWWWQLGSRSRRLPTVPAVEPNAPVTR
jgi:4-amino-4-deoxy-L-arabinose transferase-like glycosyltransferase